MGIPIGPSYVFGNNCAAGANPPHNYWLANQTPKYVYVTFGGIVLCDFAPGHLPEPPNGSTIRLTQTNGCAWSWSGGGWTAGWGLGIPNVVTLAYFDGAQGWFYFQGNNPNAKTIATNVYNCAGPFVITKSGHSELVWSVAPRKILFDYNIDSTEGTRIAVVTKDANTSQYRFANKETSMNLWVEYDHT